MNRPRQLILGLTALAALGLAGTGFSDLAPPSESKGVGAKLVGSMGLKSEIEAVGDRQLRMRYVTLEPGGVFAVHNHKDRPAVEYILSGSVTEFRGPASKEYHDGESVLSDKDTTHWWRNDGKTQAVFVVVDVFNPPTKVQ